MLARRTLLAAALPLAATAQTRTSASLGTAGPGSLFLEYGTALARHISARAPIDLVVRQTRGSNENLDLLGAGTVDLALVNMGPAWDAWHGQNAFAGRQIRSVRALAPMYETPFHAIVLADSGIASLSELAGKRVGTGPAGGPGEVFFRGLMAELGLSFEAASGTPSEMARMVGAREVAGFFYGSGLPSPPFVELSNATATRVLGFTATEGAAYVKRFGYFAPYTIAANIYRGQAAALSSFAVWNFWMARAEVPDALAAAVTASLLDDAAATRAAHPSAATTIAANASANGFVPFHPGALAAYRRAGIAIPQALGG
jgi:hypothetical protein